MRIRFVALAAGILLSAGLLGGAAAAAPYPAIYAFGDSLSDAGNDYLASFGQLPAPPYSNGRFTNGPLWVQLLSAKKGPGALGPSLAGGTDFAFGGAESGKTIVHGLEPIDLPAQLADFATTTSPASGALYTLWIGANDLFDILADTSLSPRQVSEAVDSVIDNEAVFVDGIRLLHAEKLLVVNVPDLGKTPSVIAEGSAAIKAATAISKSYNARLVTKMAALAKKYGMAISVVDVFTLIDDAIVAPAKYHFSNVKDPCWTGNYYGTGGTLCGATEAGQNRYLFFDTLHPTARSHEYIAALAEKNLPVER